MDRGRLQYSYPDGAMNKSQTAQTQSNLDVEQRLFPLDWLGGVPPMRRFLLAWVGCMVSVAPGTSYADVMAQGGITRLDSTTSTTGSFVMEVDGPGGYVCNGNPWTIAASNFPDADSFKRFFALAMLALSQGYTVVVYNSPVSESCPYLLISVFLRSEIS